MIRLLTLLYAGVCSVSFVMNAADATPAPIENKPAELQEILSRASTAESKENFRDAARLYELATQQFPHYSESWAALGEHLRFYSHDLDAAKAAFKKAIDAPRRDAQAVAYAWRGLGEIELKDGHEDKAVELLSKSLLAFPLPDTHRSLCHLYCRQRKFKEAAQHARAAVDSNPSDAIARLLYAAQLQRAGETEQGRIEFEKALVDGGMDVHGQAKGPVHCCVLYNAAGYLSVCGQNDRALAMLKRFFETPNHRHLTREEVVSDADFDSMKQSQAFITLIETYFVATPAQGIPAGAR